MEVKYSDANNKKYMTPEMEEAEKKKKDKNGYTTESAEEGEKLEYFTE